VAHLGVLFDQYKVELMQTIIRLILLLLILTPCGYAQETKAVRVDYEDHGSVPPVRAWYTCGLRLDGLQSYDSREGEKCLKEIMSHGHIKSGRIKVSSLPDEQLVVFVLESPELKLTDVDYGIRKEFRSEFQDYLASTPFIPLVGDTYDMREENPAAQRIENFFGAKGFRVAVTKRVDLNYNSGTASITYRVWEGPEGAIVPLPQPSGCEIMIGSFSMIDVDDFTPLDLIRESRQSQTFSCYSDRAIQQDEDNLKKTGIFTEIHYSVDGTGDRRSVSVHARAKPLVVSSVLIDGFGLIATQDLEKQFGKSPDLPVQTNRIYSQAEARGSVKLLEAQFNSKNVKARIYESDELLPNSTFKVTFHVLAYPPNELYIDGQRLE
jgi:outer membrane protein assembly factor BamA